MITFRDLFSYFKKERESLLRAFDALSDEEFTMDRGLSLGSLKNVFVHTVMVEDIWIHHRIAGQGAHPPYQPHDFVDLLAVKQYIDAVDRKTEVFFHTMTEERLQRRVNVVRPNGRTTDDTIGDVLYQIPIKQVVQDKQETEYIF